MKYPQDSERILAVLTHLNLTAYKIAKELNYKSASSFYEVEKGNKPISEKMARKIIARYPQIHLKYLLGSSNEIVLTEAQQNHQRNLEHYKKMYNSADFAERMKMMEITVKDLYTTVGQLVDLNKKLLDRQEAGFSRNYEQFQSVKELLKN